MDSPSYRQVLQAFSSWQEPRDRVGVLATRLLLARSSSNWIDLLAARCRLLLGRTLRDFSSWEEPSRSGWCSCHQASSCQESLAIGLTFLGAGFFLAGPSEIRLTVLPVGFVLPGVLAIGLTFLPRRCCRLLLGRNLGDRVGVLTRRLLLGRTLRDSFDRLACGLRLARSSGNRIDLLTRSGTTAFGHRLRLARSLPNRIDLLASSGTTTFAGRLCFGPSTFANKGTTFASRL